MVFVKANQAFVVDITVRYESKSTYLEDRATEKVNKYQHLKVQEWSKATNIKFIVFPLEAYGKWYEGNN